MPEDPAEAPSRKGGKSRLLTRAAIARAAFDLIDVDGEEALTIARLARRLGVGTMTLYGYVESKSAIVAMLPGVLLDELPPLELDGPWEAVIEDCYLAIYRRLIAHGHVTQTIARAPVFGSAQASLFESILELMRRAGFSSGEAASLHRSLRTYTIGYALYQVAESSSDASGRAWLDALPAEEYPRTREVRDNQSGLVDVQQYVRGLRHIDSGFAADSATRGGGRSAAGG
jgi:AcrR family transcriptional regulator